MHFDRRGKVLSLGRQRERPFWKHFLKLIYFQMVAQFWHRFAMHFAEWTQVFIPIPLCYKTTGKTKHFSKDFSKSGSGISVAKPNRAGGENKNRAQKINTYLALICQLCGKLLRPAIWWFHITSLGSNVPRCSVTTKSFIQRFLGSFSCDNILANNRSLVKLCATSF